MMRVLFLLVLGVFLSGCGESDSAPQRPESVRKCGELDGVEPVEPVVSGAYPIDWGDEALSCPMFAPVPCTEPLIEYSSLCGSECVPQTAEGADGDTWLVGCAWARRGVPTTGFDFHLVQCSHDPYEGREYWLEFFESSAPFLPLAYCWPTCEDGKPLNEPAEWCP
jgi:hypothetical protein